MRFDLKKFIPKIFPLNGGIVIIIILSFVLGWEVGYRNYHLQLQNYTPNITITNQSSPDQNVNIDFSLFWQVWSLVHQKYIDKSALDANKLYYGAIQGMVAAIGDPYTVFLPPQEQKQTQEQLQGSFEGIGIELGYNKDKHLVVIAPLKDTPADKAGVKAGDLILKINGKDATNLSLPEAVNVIRGPKNSSVTLQLFSANDTQPHDLTITRDTIEVKSVTYTQKQTQSGKKVALIQITSFGEKTNNEWDSAVNQALSDGDQAVIVDVRNNPGGYLDSAVYIASEFLNGGTVVEEEDYSGNTTDLSVNRAGKMLNVPMVVLINQGSASASEIFAGSMQDRKRAMLIGTQSFGKGTIQSAQDLSEGTGIHITTAKWLTPNGRWIHQIGLTPDVKVDAGNDASQDPQLDKALELLN